MATLSNTIFDCLVISGGGAKGAYGAGAAKALFDYYAFKQIERTVCFVGTSAGALNVAVLAAEGPVKLISLWRSMTLETVLGVSSINRSALLKQRLYRGFRRFMDGEHSPFSLYDNVHLRRLIARHVDITKLIGKHVVLAVTNFSTSQMKAAYSSAFLTAYVGEDQLLPPSKRRLAHFTPITDQSSLVDYLLASASIPYIFPPVRIGGDLYVDGGVGNHTPTREAALLLRRIDKSHTGIAGDTYCVSHDPPDLVHADPNLGATQIILRTMDVFHYVHQTPILQAWDRINREVEEHQTKIDEFEKWLSTNSGLSAAQASTVATEARQRLGSLGGAAPRKVLKLHIIQPSSSLGDTLNFNRQQSEENIKRGYVDMITTLRIASKLDVFDAEMLLKERVFPEKL